MDLEPPEEDISKGDDQGDPFSRRARVLIYVIAAGFIVVGGLDLAAYWMKCRRDHVDIGIGRCLYLSIPLVIGLVILIKSSALARRVDEYLDE